MKKLLLALTIIIVVAGYVFAEVQEVKVGGDVEIRGIYQDDFDFTGNSGDESTSWYESTVRVYVDAQLTENVRGYIRLINERDWGVTGALGTYTTEIDLAYIELSDAFSLPLTLTLGRQELAYGESFLIGAGDSRALVSSRYSWLLGFDALRASYEINDEMTLDVVVAKLDEGGNIAISDDEDLYGVNLNYLIGDIGILDAGFWLKRDRDASAGQETHALSIRAESEIPAVPGLSLKGEIVPEWGDYNNTRDLDAFGGYIGANYAWDAALKPFVSLNYIYMSGDPGSVTGDFEEFDTLYDDEAYGEIAEDLPSPITTNAKIINLGVGIAPRENLSLEINYYNYTADENLTGMTSDDLGDEVDLSLVYSYSEGVTFGLIAGYLDPGAGLTAGTEEAMQVMGTMTLNF